MIYRNDVDFFLECFSTNLYEISDIWKEKGGFVPLCDLAESIIKRKGFAPSAESAMLKIAQRSFPKDFRSGAFERQNFFYGLADYYAETQGEPTAIVEFDVGNCNGTGDYFGDESLFKIIRFMRYTFEQTMTDHGATFVQAFDNAKNDDLKLIVTGLRSEKLTEAINDAQDRILKKFIFASNIPHSKYADGLRDGIGVGSGFADLGKGYTPQQLQETLNLFVEKRKLEDSEARLEIRNDASFIPMAPVLVRGILTFSFNEDSFVQPEPKKDFPYSLESVKHIADPFEAREVLCRSMADELGMTAAEKRTFDNVLKFYHSSEALTEARRDNFLYEDMVWVEQHQGQPVTILNVKVENCAGINKVLSHIHSAEMTKHFVSILSDFMESNFNKASSNLVYYVGRNTFNVIVPSYESENVQDIFQQYFQQEVDAKINNINCGEYFNQLGLTVPQELKNTKVGDIKNLRGLKSGVLAININAKETSAFANEADLIRFQNNCISTQRGKIPNSELNLPDNITYHEIAAGKTPAALLKTLQKMAWDLIERERTAENQPDVSSLPPAKRKFG